MNHASSFRGRHRQNWLALKTAVTDAVSGVRRAAYECWVFFSFFGVVKGEYIHTPLILSLCICSFTLHSSKDVRRIGCCFSCYLGVVLALQEGWDLFLWCFLFSLTLLCRGIPEPHLIMEVLYPGLVLSSALVEAPLESSDGDMRRYYFFFPPQMHSLFPTLFLNTTIMITFSLIIMKLTHMHSCRWETALPLSCSVMTLLS